MEEVSALIGHTGFVGGNLKSQHKFGSLYNTKNISEIEGREFDLVVSAATPAEMWRANQEPEADMASIQALMAHLSKIKAKQFTLISTIAVYASPIGVDETSDLDIAHATAYGIHRARLEDFCREHFENLLIVRLPGLFGDGLKKNVIYDFIHNNNVDRIDSRGVFQFYNLAHIWSDIETARSNNLELVNFAAEPTSVTEIARSAFALDFDQKTLPDDKIAEFDMHTSYANAYGKTGSYIATKTEVLADIKAFVQSQTEAVK